MNVASVAPADIMKDDTFVSGGKDIWTAISDARVVFNEVHIDVRFCVDGGASTRVWGASDEDFCLTVRRAV